MHRLSCPFMAIIAFIFCVSTRISAITIWQEVFSPEEMRIFNAICSSDSAIVAVGDSGAWQSCRSGNAWAQGRLDSRASMTSITRGDSLFVCVGYKGACAISQNGTDWIEGIMPGKNDLYDVCWGDSCFVAAGSNAALF
jgi:hypothetical protein